MVLHVTLTSTAAVVCCAPSQSHISPEVTQGTLQIRIRFVRQRSNPTLETNKQVLRLVAVSFSAKYNITYFIRHSPNVFSTPITAMGCRHSLPLSFVQLKGKHCQKNPIALMGLYIRSGTFGLVQSRADCNSKS
jgi:hypothetical protein